MKLLMLSLTAFLLCQSVHAGNWAAVEKPGGVTTIYNQSQEQCEKAEQMPCYEITGKNLEYWELGEIEVDDTNKPIFRNIQDGFVTDCDSFEHCASLITAETCPEGETPRWAEKSTLGQVLNKIKNLELDAPGGWTLWCEKRLGFEKKKVKALIENAQKKAAHEKAIKDKDDARKARKTKAKDSCSKAKGELKDLCDYLMGE